MKRILRRFTRTSTIVRFDSLRHVDPDEHVDEEPNSSNKPSMEEYRAAQLEISQDTRRSGCDQGIHGYPRILAEGPVMLEIATPP